MTDSLPLQVIRDEVWKVNYDEDHVGFAHVYVLVDETVKVAYPILKSLMETAGMTKIEENDDRPTEG